MFGLGKTLSGPQISFFDVRVTSSYKNLIIVRGSQYDSPSVVLAGDLVFSLNEDITMKRVGLRLVGRYKLDFLEVLSQENGTVSNPVKEESIVFEANWDNLLTDANGVIGPTDGPTGGTLTPTRRLMRSSTPVNLQVNGEGHSGTPFSEAKSLPGTSFTLSQGNYELPFKCILPGDIPETVEGLMAGSILYKFEAIVDRGGFKSPITKFKYFRILRTLSTDNFALSETISIGKSWPNKIQYEVSIPSRAVPIGGSTPINILLVPLCKGLTLGSVNAQLVQYYAFRGFSGDIYDDEQVILDCKMDQMKDKLLDGRFSIDSFIKIPSNLKKVTQDCDLKGESIKVRHKLKLQINLANSGGNKSELRTYIPITLFISPDVEMSGRTIVLDKHGKIHFRKEEDQLFETNRLVNHSTAQQPSFPSSTRESAPPNYEEHVYDRMIFHEGVVDSANTPPVPLLHQGDYFLGQRGVPDLPMHELLEEELLNVPSYNAALENHTVSHRSEDFAPSY